MKTAYMVVAVPGSGKTWVCEQIMHLFEYVHHDLYVGMAGGTYVKAIMKASLTAEKPLLIEAPFSISQIKDPLEERGFKIIPVFIIEQPAVIAARYRKREQKSIPTQHLTRMRTFAERAKKWKAFAGTSSEVLAHLKKIGQNHASWAG